MSRDRDYPLLPGDAGYSPAPPKTLKQLTSFCRAWTKRKRAVERKDKRAVAVLLSEVEDYCRGNNEGLIDSWYLTGNGQECVKISRDLVVRPVPVSGRACRSLPGWLVQLGFTHEFAELRPCWQRAVFRAWLKASQEAAASPPPGKGVTFVPHKVARFPRLAGLGTIACLARLVGMGVVSLHAETARFELRPRYRRPPGLDRIRKALGPELFTAIFRVTRRWSPPKGVELMQFDEQRSRQAAFARMKKLGIVEVVHKVCVAELGAEDEDDESLRE